MRGLVTRFKRGYAWERKHGATDPLMRAGLSLLFLVACMLFASSTMGWVFTTIFAVMLVVTWIGVTINGSKWADEEDEKNR